MKSNLRLQREIDNSGEKSDTIDRQCINTNTGLYSESSFNVYSSFSSSSFCSLPAFSSSSLSSSSSSTLYPLLNATNLPLDLLGCIFDFLPTSDMTNCVKVSTHWKKVEKYITRLAINYWPTKVAQQYRALAQFRTIDSNILHFSFNPAAEAEDDASLHLYPLMISYFKRLTSIELEGPNLGTIQAILKLGNPNLEEIKFISRDRSSDDDEDIKFECLRKLKVLKKLTHNFTHSSNDYSKFNMLEYLDLNMNEHIANYLILPPNLTTLKLSLESGGDMLGFNEDMIHNWSIVSNTKKLTTFLLHDEVYHNQAFELFLQKYNSITSLTLIKNALMPQTLSYLATTLPELLFLRLQDCTGNVTTNVEQSTMEHIERIDQNFSIEALIKCSKLKSLEISKSSLTKEGFLHLTALKDVGCNVVLL